LYIVDGELNLSWLDSLRGPPYENIFNRLLGLASGELGSLLACYSDCRSGSFFFKIDCLAVPIFFYMKVLDEMDAGLVEIGAGRALDFFSFFEIGLISECSLLNSGERLQGSFMLSG
jgi:hypothetical protein